MNPIAIRIARRLGLHAYTILHDTSLTSKDFFIGLGWCLAVCFEEMTGKSAKNLHPGEIIQWALNLPDEKYPIIRR